LLAARYRRRWTALLERLPYAANGLPGIVVALSLVFFTARYASFAYQTLALLVFAYVIRFLPQSLAAVGSAFESLSPRLEEAARGLGRRPAAAFTTVTLRLSAPGIGAGAALVLLSSMKELPVTLLLRPTGFDTLATEVWTATSLGAYAEAAPSALLLVAVATPFVWALAARPSWELGAPG
jgi:iron(III) transport system permease protein